MSQFNQQFIVLIVDRYGLELEDDRIDSVVTTWIGQYDRGWIVKAIVESIHRGRYKIKSVDSILSGWQRSGKPSYNFTPEFEREILQDFPVTSDLAENQAPSILPQLDETAPAIQFPGWSSEQLNPEESAPFPRHDCCRSDANPFFLRRREASRSEKTLCERDASRTPTTSSRCPLLTHTNGREPPVRCAAPSCVCQRRGVVGFPTDRVTRFVDHTTATRQDRRQSVLATPILHPPTVERGTTFPQTEIEIDRTSPSIISFNGEDDVKPNHVNPHPKFQLFHTLRAIVTPNNLQATELDNLDPPSYSIDLA